MYLKFFRRSQNSLIKCSLNNSHLSNQMIDSSLSEPNSQGCSDDSLDELSLTQPFLILPNVSVPNDKSIEDTKNDDKSKFNFNKKKLIRNKNWKYVSNLQFINNNNNSIFRFTKNTSGYPLHEPMLPFSNITCSSIPDYFGLLLSESRALSSYYFPKQNTCAVKCTEGKKWG